MSNASSNNADSSVAQGGFTKEKVITYIFALIALGLLAYGLINLNNWRRINPEQLAEARVAQESGLTRAEASSLYERQLGAAEQASSQYLKSGIIFLILAALAYYISKKWQAWRNIFGEQMLYVYAFLLPFVGWILYLFAYPTRGDPNRKVIRKNIGIMSLALPAGIIAYYLVYLIQAYVISPLGHQVATSDFLVGVFNFFLSVQIPQIVGVVVGAYVAFRTRDVRAIAVAAQLVVLAVVLVVFNWLFTNAASGIESRGMSATDFGFLKLTAGFDISETLIDYSRSSTYGQAFLAGALNTLLVSVVGIILATLLGLVVGVARLSHNWLVSTLARAFVEAMRNVPLLVLLFFLYSAVLLQLPKRADTISVLGGRILLNNRGLAFPWPKATANFDAWIPFLIIAFIVTGVLWYFRNRTIPSTGRPAFTIWYVLLGFVVVSGIGIFITHPLIIQTPHIKGLNYAKNEDGSWIGLVMSPEFAGILFGLVLYTGAYIGEVVRAGIQAVSKGQREAATAIGLTNNQSLQLIILPQALQVIIPPLTNQYLNLAKNSSLAIGIGYADLFAVATTTFNQSGQSVQVILMIMASYLTLSLTISFIMNQINRRVQIRER